MSWVAEVSGELPGIWWAEFEFMLFSFADALAEQASPDDAGRDCQELPYQQPDNGARRVWHLGRWLDMRPAVH